MKKLSLLVLAFVALFFTSCGKDPITNPEETNLVPVTLEIPIDNGSKTDFSDFLTGNAENASFKIKWRTDIEEKVYLAIPAIQNEDENGNITSSGKAQIVTLTGESNPEGTSITFAGVVDEKLLRSTLKYTLYYMGDGDVKLTTKDGVTTGVEMSFDNQDGSRKNLGKSHFATMDVRVKLIKVGNEVIAYNLTYVNTGNFTSQVGVAYLDLKGETTLTGCSNGVSVMYNESANEFVAKYSWDKINLVNPSEKSLVVLAPGTTEISCNKGSYTFKNGVAANSVYYNIRTFSNGQAPEIIPLKWN